MTPFFVGPEYFSVASQTRRSTRILPSFPMNFVTFTVEFSLSFSSPTASDSIFLLRIGHHIQHVAGKTALPYFRIGDEIRLNGSPIIYELPAFSRK